MIFPKFVKKNIIKYNINSFFPNQSKEKNIEKINQLINSNNKSKEIQIKRKLIPNKFLCSFISKNDLNEKSPIKISIQTLQTVQLQKMFEKEQKIFQNLTIFSKSQNKEEKEEEIIDFSFRIKAIQKIDTICSKLNFQNETFFFAVYYLDKMISSLPLTLKNQSDFAIIACVSIAGKVYEEEVPSISCFQMFFPKYHKKSKSYNQISNLEVELIKIIDSFIPTTVNSFLEYFLSRVSNFLQVNKEKKEIFIFQNEKNQFIVQDDDIYTKMIKLIKIVIKNPISVNFFPSEIAASILSIYFPDDDLIIFVTGYSIKQLEECRNLFNLYNNNLDFKF